MKKIIGFLILLASLGCSSDFDFQTSQRQVYTFDEDGDPVIENPDNIDTNGLGLAGGYCYGFSLPDAEIAEIDVDIFYPENLDLSGFLPSVGNQGKQGSCVAWATGYYLKSFHENYENLMNGDAMNKKMSPAFIYNQIKVSGCDDGSNVQRALDTIYSSGIPSLIVMPYDENDCETQPTEVQKSMALPNKIRSYHYLDQDKVFEQTRAFLLNEQPVVIAITIDRNYFGARDENGVYIYRKFKESSGGHAMLVVGYDDDMNAFKVVNSWGESWGNKGFVWIDYKAFKEAGQSDSDFQVLCEAWVTEDIILQAVPI
jgi:C1A family cysteine protease